MADAAGRHRSRRRTARSGAARTARGDRDRDQHAQIIAQSREEHFYDLPPELLGKLWGGKYRGQRQHWFLARFTGGDHDVRLDAHDPPEFCEWQWVEPERLPELIVPFKKPVYRAVLEEFRALI